jgi:hypothetical protein
MLCFALVLGEFSRLQGNPVEIRGCPAAVSENETHSMHWPSGWEAMGGRKTAKAEMLASPKTYRRTAKERQPTPLRTGPRGRRLVGTVFAFVRTARLLRGHARGGERLDSFTRRLVVGPTVGPFLLPVGVSTNEGAPYEPRLAKANSH